MVGAGGQLLPDVAALGEADTIHESQVGLEGQGHSWGQVMDPLWNACGVGGKELPEGSGVYQGWGWPLPSPPQGSLLEPYPLARVAGWGEAELVLEETTPHPGPPRTRIHHTASPRHSLPPTTAQSRAHTVLVPVPVIVPEVSQPAAGHQGQALVLGEKPPAHAGGPGVAGEDGGPLGLLPQWRSPTSLLRGAGQHSPHAQLGSRLHRDLPPDLVQRQVPLQRAQHLAVALQEEGGRLVVLGESVGRDGGS